MPPRPPFAVFVLAGALVVASAFALTVALTSGGSSSRSSSAGSLSQATSPSGFRGALLPAGARSRGFALTDQRGRRVSLSDFRGRVTILAFLSSACPRTCTLIAQQIRGALDELGAGVPTLLVSVDPAADAPARVRSFLERVSLQGRVEYLSGSRARLAAVWRAYAISPLSAGEDAFSRTASVYLLDRAGSERVVFQLEQLTPESLASDARRLAREP